VSSRTPFWRRNIFIKRRFQADFSIKFLILILVEAVLAIGLFLYLSKDTITTGYSGSELIISKTRDFFLPSLLLSNLIVVGITAIIGVIVFLIASHKLAGPLYRFEKTLENMGSGDLTHRFSLRQKDQMKSLADKINELNIKLEQNMLEIQRNVGDLKEHFAEIESTLSSESYDKKKLEGKLRETSGKLHELEKFVRFFRTSRTEGEGESGST
jgi:methyl-accepting chemotaxis protein